jgi:predicted transcriptional regulator
MTIYGEDIYIATGGTGSVIPGSNKLFRAQISGVFTPPVEVGTFTGIGDYGFSGIAAPEPSILAAAGLGALALWRRRK